MDPKISVIVPVYNVIEYLNDCINSVINQTYKELEIILIDDGSTDGSSIECDKIALIDKRIKVIHQENSGVSTARNVGLQVAEGEFIAFVDADDTLQKEMYATLMANIMEYNADISVAGFSINDVEIEKKDDKKSLTKLISQQESIKDFLLGEKFCDGLWRALYRKTCVKNVFFKKDIKIGEDKLFIFEAITKANLVCYSERKLYNYYIRENSAMQSDFSKKNNDNVIMAKIILNKIEKKYPEYRDYAQYFFYKECIESLHILGRTKNRTEFVDYEKYYLETIKKTNIMALHSLFSLKEKVIFFMICISKDMFYCYVNIVYFIKKKIRMRK